MADWILDHEAASSVRAKLNMTSVSAATDIDDADYIQYYDTSATTMKKSLWSNLKSKAVSSVTSDIDNIKINALLTDLKLATNSSNIDAWAYIQTVSSAQSFIGGGTTGTLITYTSDYENYFCQQFTAPSSGSMTGVKFYLSGNTNYASTVYAKLYAASAGIPTGSVLATSSSVTVGIGSDSPTAYTFSFPTPYSLVSGTSYCMVIYVSDYYIKAFGDTTASNASYYSYWSSTNGTSWTVTTRYMYMNIMYNSTVSNTWGPVTPTKSISRIALVSNYSGSNTLFYVSGDNSNWTQITSLNTFQTLGSAISTIYIKATLSNGASLTGIAWGC